MYSTNFKTRLQLIKHEKDIMNEAKEKYNATFKNLLKDGLRELKLDGVVSLSEGKPLTGVLKIRETENADFPYRYAFYRHLKNSDELSKVEESIPEMSASLVRAKVRGDASGYLSSVSSLFSPH